MAIMIENIKKMDCTGCHYCEDTCPEKAITLEPDSEGFLYPKVVDSKCTRCGLCLTECPSINPINQIGEIQPRVYAGWSKDDKRRIASTSGGLFSEFAQAIMKRGGSVIAAVYDEKFRVCHITSNKIDAIEQMRQSKYVQSRLNDQYREAEKLLLEGKDVLFCGTPCQNAGFSKMINHKNYAGRLYQLDFICRGVISPKVYAAYLEDLRTQYGSEIRQIHFKNKDVGWNQFETKIKFNNGKIYHKDRYQDPYMVGYLQYNLYVRPSCYTCKYKSLPRISDITLGDFWGISKVDSNLDDNKGTSVIMINTTKGKELFDEVESNICISETTIENVIPGNACLLESIEMPKYRDTFYKMLETKSFSAVIKSIKEKDL